MGSHRLDFEGRLLQMLQHRALISLYKPSLEVYCFMVSTVGLFGRGQADLQMQRVSWGKTGVWGVSTIFLGLRLEARFQRRSKAIGLVCMNFTCA